jgi:hypothetical protein
MQRRRGLFSRIMGAIDRLVNLGGGTEESRTPHPPQEAPPQYEDFEPLPMQPTAPPPPPSAAPIEETTITTPIIPYGDNTEYIPGHMSGKNGRNPVYGRWRVTDPELGDISDLISKVPSGRVTFVICGQMEVYANLGIHEPGCKSYPFNSEDIEALLDSQVNSKGEKIEFAQDLFNDMLVRDNTEFSSISEVNVLNKEDDPRANS